MELACKVRVKVKSNSNMHKGGWGSVEMARKVKIATSVSSFVVLPLSTDVIVYFCKSKGKKAKSCICFC